jgi:hypothetical protein
VRFRGCINIHIRRIKTDTDAALTIQIAFPVIVSGQLKNISETSFPTSIMNSMTTDMVDGIHAHFGSGYFDSCDDFAIGWRGVSVMVSRSV